MTLTLKDGEEFTTCGSETAVLNKLRRTVEDIDSNLIPST